MRVWCKRCGGLGRYLSRIKLMIHSCEVCGGNGWDPTELHWSSPPKIFKQESEPKKESTAKPPTGDAEWELAE